MGTLHREIDEIKPERIVSLRQQWGFSSPNTPGLRHPSVGGGGMSPLVPHDFSDTFATSEATNTLSHTHSLSFYKENKYLTRTEMQAPLNKGANFTGLIVCLNAEFVRNVILPYFALCWKNKTGMLQLITQIQRSTPDKMISFRSVSSSSSEQALTLGRLDPLCMCPFF